MEEMENSVRKSHILVVDDEDEILWFCQSILKRDEYEITTVNTGKGAMDLIDAFVAGNNPPFDVAIIDLNLVDLDGTIVINKIKELRKSHPNFKHVKVIAISGDINMARMLKDLGADEFFEKPLGVDVLRETVKKLLG